MSSDVSQHLIPDYKPLPLSGAVAMTRPWTCSPSLHDPHERTLRPIPWQRLDDPKWCQSAIDGSASRTAKSDRWIDRTDDLQSPSDVCRGTAFDVGLVCLRPKQRFRVNPSPIRCNHRSFICLGAAPPAWPSASRYSRRSFSKSGSSPLTPTKPPLRGYRESLSPAVP
jgi:hypothetical protein